MRSNSINIRRRNVLYVSRILPNWENIQGYSQKLRLFKLRLSYTKNISRFPCLVLCVANLRYYTKTNHSYVFLRKKGFVFLYGRKYFASSFKKYYYQISVYFFVCPIIKNPITNLPQILIWELSKTTGMLNHIKNFNALKFCKSNNLSNSHKTTHGDWRHVLKYWQERNVCIVENYKTTNQLRQILEPEKTYPLIHLLIIMYLYLEAINVPQKYDKCTEIYDLKIVIK